MQKCKGTACPKKHECLRFTELKKDKPMSQVPFDPKIGRCDHIIKTLMV